MQRPIRVYDKSLNLLTETDNYNSLQFMPRFYDVGEFELHINQYIEGAEYFVKGNLLVLDKDQSKAMIIRHREIALDESGRASENWKITGVTLEGVLDQRITIPPKDTSHDRKSGSAETVMKHYVDRHFVNPDDPARKIDYIEIAEDKNRGSHIEWESRFKTVSEEIAAISKQANLGWVMYADMDRRKWVFDVVEPRDVTVDNEKGLQPVFFSPDFSTIKSQSFVDSDTNYRNVGYVGGQGEGVDRKVVEIGEGKGIDRLEIFIDARDVDDTKEGEDGEEIPLPEEEVEQQLIERGLEKMKEHETTFYLEAQILTPVINDRRNEFVMATPFEYEKDFFLGDLVQIFNKKWNITMKAPITEFKEVHEPSGFVLEATFGEAQPTIINKIQGKFDEIAGVEKQELPAKISVRYMEEAKEFADGLVTEEERARMQQAQENLEAAKNFTTEYAEKKRVEGPTAPDDKNVIWIDTSNPDNIIWRVWNGYKWVAGPSGPQGVPGPPGEDGQSLYTWIKFADDEYGNGMSEDPTGKAYIGISYNNTSQTESADPASYLWTKIVGPEGDQGIPGPPGEDGESLYTWLKYADDAQGNGMTDNPEGKDYIGLAYNKTVQQESDNPADYTWSLIRGPKGEQGPRGLQGLQGEKGEQGIPGEPGEDGLNAYTHIAYANSADGVLDFSISESTSRAYLGMYVDHNPEDSTNPADYKWTLIKGADGEQGIPGQPGEDGRTPYLHIAYANSSDGTEGFSITESENKLYIGQYTDFTKGDSTDPSRYSWTLIKGEKGEKGDQGPKGDKGPKGDQGIQGPPGEDGKPSYTHIAYANSSDGSVDFSVSDSLNKSYIGMYVDSNPTDSSNPSDYRWTYVKGPKGEKGEQGPKGDEGIPGPPGEDGRTPYFHVAYANSADGSSGFSTSVSEGKLYIGQYTDFTQADSTDPSKYSWTKIKGEQGERGPQGPRGPNIVDTNTSFGVDWLIADHIKSLNGLNVGNGQFVVDDSGNVTFGGTLSGADGTFSGTVQGARLISESGSGIIEINDGMISSYTNGRETIRMQNYSMFFYDDLDYLLTGTIGLSHAGTGLSGISINNYKDYFSIGFSDAGNSSIVNNIAYWNRAGRQGIVSGANKDDWEGRLELRASFTDQTDQPHVPNIAISNYADGEAFGGVFITVGRNNNAPSTSERYGLEVWQHTGAGDGVKIPLIISDQMGSMKRTTFADSIAIGYERADEPRFRIFYDVSGDTYFQTLGTDNYWNNTFRIDSRGSSSMSFYPQNIYLRGTGARRLWATDGNLTLRTDHERIFLQSPLGTRVVKPGTSATYVAIRASAFYTGSIEESKTDIHLMPENALDIIINSDLYKYRLKTDIEDGVDEWNYGLVIGSGRKTPEQVIDNEGQAISQYAMNTFSWKAIQELAEIVFEQREEIKLLKEEINK